MGDRICVLKDGVLQQVGTPRDLYETPNNVFVAGFIGSPAMNLMTVPIGSGGVQIGKFLLPLERDELTRLASLGIEEVTIGLRPENLGIVEGGGEGFEGKVDLIEELGSESYVYAHLDDPKVKGLDGGAVSLVARSAVRAPAKIGQSIGLTRLDGAIHLFHPETGERI